MLQTPESSLLARHRHRRQQSASSAFDALAISQQRPAAAGHRRGRQSLDIRQQKQRNNHMWQANSTVSTEHTNNPGSAIFQQQYAQQHSTQVSPGQQNGLCSPSEEALISPLGTPQMPGGMDQFEFNMMDGGPFAADWTMTAGRQNNDFDLYSQPSATSTPTFAAFPNGQGDVTWFNLSEAGINRGQRRSIGSAVQKRIDEYESISQVAQRPITPPEQNTSCKSSGTTGSASR